MLAWQNLLAPAAFSLALFCGLWRATPARGADEPGAPPGSKDLAASGEVKLPTPGWRPVRQALQIAAEQAGLRWAMPATINRRVFIGSSEGSSQPVAEFLKEVAQKAGLTHERFPGLVVLHAGKDDLRKAWVGKLAGTGRSEKLAALHELGWLQDLRAWPELARVVCGSDVELALAAAQAMRRLDGEKALDWRLFGESDFEPTSIRPWQAPLGLAFPEACVFEEAERLAGSPFIPLWRQTWDGN